MPAGRARRARPKGVSRRGPEGATAAAGRQGVREGGSEGEGNPPQNKIFTKKKFFAKKSPEGGLFGEKNILEPGEQ